MHVFNYLLTVATDEWRCGVSVAESTVDDLNAALTTRTGPAFFRDLTALAGGGPLMEASVFGGASPVSPDEIVAVVAAAAWKKPEHVRLYVQAQEAESFQQIHPKLLPALSEVEVVTELRERVRTLEAKTRRMRDAAAEFVNANRTLIHPTWQSHFLRAYDLKRDPESQRVFRDREEGEEEDQGGLG